MSLSLGLYAAVSAEAICDACEMPPNRHLSANSSKVILLVYRFEFQFLIPHCSQQHNCTTSAEFISSLFLFYIHHRLLCSVFFLHQTIFYYIIIEMSKFESTQLNTVKCKIKQNTKKTKQKKNIRCDAFENRRSSMAGTWYVIE